MITTEFMNYLLAVGVRDGTKSPNWFVAPFKGNYTPTADDVAATFSTVATESTAYEGALRSSVVFAQEASGAVDATQTIELTATAVETWYGAFIISSSSKGATTGVLQQVVRFATPRSMTVGSKLELEIGIDLLQPT